VTVTGTGFVPGDSTVTIGGVTIPADQVTVTSPTTLRFVTPAGAAGAVDVTVTTDGTTSNAGVFTYTDSAAGGSGSAGSGVLAFTGVDLPVQLVVAFLLAAAGAATLWWGRNRRRPAHARP
jgi:hypothetical protein